MTAFDAHEPTADQLALASSAYEIALLSFSREPERLEPGDPLPRYHRIKIEVRCRAVCASRPLYLTVRRSGSKIGAENFYTVPFFARDMPVGSVVAYDLLSFDSFNLPFADVSVEMCRPEDYPKRRVSPAHIERARKFALPIGGNNG